MPAFENIVSRRAITWRPLRASPPVAGRTGGKGTLRDETPAQAPSCRRDRRSQADVRRPGSRSRQNPYRDGPHEEGGREPIHSRGMNVTTSVWGFSEGATTYSTCSWTKPSPRRPGWRTTPSTSAMIRRRRSLPGYGRRFGIGWERSKHFCFVRTSPSPGLPSMPGCLWLQKKASSMTS